MYTCEDALKEKGLDLFSIEQQPEETQDKKKVQDIIIQHGLLGQSSNWRNIIRSPEIKKRECRIIALDLRNHGNSPHTDDNSFISQVDDIIRLLDKKSIKEGIQVGHSLGGKIAMATALLYPERVSKLVVVDIAPVK